MAKNTKYLPEIDGVRAIAVLAVIANHLNASWLPSGHLGVDIFFVISGYVITTSLLASRQEGTTIARGILGFYTRRVKRLVPALLFYVVAMGIVLSLFNPKPSTDGYTGIAAIFALSNFYLLSTATDYFGQSADLNFFTHTWTLAVEEQFYLVYPLVLFSLLSVFGASRGRKYLVLFLGVTIILSGILYVSLLERSPLLSFYMMPMRFWELGIGCLLALLLENPEGLLGKFRGFDSNVLIVLIVASLFSPLSLHGMTIFVVVGLTALLLLSIRSLKHPSKILTHPIMLRIGLISYSLYLWHWGLIVLARWTVGHSWWTIALQVIAMFILALFSYRYVESPVRHARWTAKNSVILTGGLTASIAAAASVLLLTTNEPSRLYLGATDAKPSQFKESQIFQPRKNFWALLQTVREKRIACNMTPQYLSKDNAPPNIDNSFLSKCLASERQKVVLVGDSFANAISDHVAFAADQQGYDFRLLFGYACPYPLDLNNIEHANKHKCDADANVLLASIEENLNPGDVLVHRLYYQKNQYIVPDSRAIVSTFSSYDAEISKLLSLVRRKSASLLVVGTNWEINPCEHAEWFNQLQCPSDVRMSDRTRNTMAVGINRHFRQMEIEDSNVDFLVIDPIEELCTKDPVVCPVKRRGLNFMRDQYHLSHAGVDKLFDSISSAIESFPSQPNY